MSHPGTSLSCDTHSWTDYTSSEHSWYKVQLRTNPDVSYSIVYKRGCRLHSRLLTEAGPPD